MTTFKEAFKTTTKPIKKTTPPTTAAYRYNNDNQAIEGPKVFFSCNPFEAIKVVQALNAAYLQGYERGHKTGHTEGYQKVVEDQKRQKIGFERYLDKKQKRDVEIKEYRILTILRALRDQPRLTTRQIRMYLEKCGSHQLQAVLHELVDAGAIKSHFRGKSHKGYKITPAGLAALAEEEATLQAPPTAPPAPAADAQDARDENAAYKGAFSPERMQGMMKVPGA